MRLPEPEVPFALAMFEAGDGAATLGGHGVLVASLGAVEQFPSQRGVVERGAGSPF